ncbi:MAG: ROK family transcriptional regulator [Planctomycetaceae bacterium]|nr:ROK family transcriptional regulator [Planctomycetaceae bacterium]
MADIATPESIGEANKRVLLRLLRADGPLSRADLARHSGMSFPTVSSNIRFLLDHGYVVTHGAGGNQLGRKSVLLSYNAARGFLVGVDVGRTRIRVMAADLLGDVLWEDSRPFDASRSGVRTRAAIAGAVAAAAESVPAGHGRCICVCIGLPGIIRDNAIRLAPNFSDFPLDALRADIHSRHGAAVLYENGVNLGAKGELWKGAGRDYRDILYVSHGVGIGAALILDGRLYQGADGAAGEIGFAIIAPASESLPESFPKFLSDRSFRRTGDSGELENALSLERFGPVPGGGRKRTGATADQWDDAALETVSDRFSMALTNASALLNPRAVIVSGGWGRTLGKIFLPDWKERMAAALPFPPDLFLSDLDNRETMLGAVHAAIEYAEGLPFESVTNSWRSD